MQDDITDATRWAIQQGIADADRICIYGASYGAYAALMGVAREPALYQCAIGYIGVYDLPLLYAQGDTRELDSGMAFLRAAGVPVETLYYDTEGHGFHVDAHRVAFNAQVLAFLGRHLGPGRSGTAVPEAASAAD